MNLKELPALKREGLLKEFGPAAKHWISNFPSLIDACIERFQIRLIETATAGLTINVIYLAETEAGDPVVLKLGYPHPEQVTEQIALFEYRAHERPLIVELLDSEPSLGAVLLARAMPGITFRESGSTIARSAEIPEVIGALPFRTSVINGLPMFDDWIETAFNGFREKFELSHPFAHHLARAEKLYAELRSNDPEKWLLHGDLHHENILKDETRGWIAIDPKGVIGPRVMECGRFLHNFLVDEVEGATHISDTTVDQLCDVLQQRYTLMAERFQVEVAEIAAVSYVDCVLSFCWTINSAGEWRDEALRVDATQAMLK